MPAQVLIAGQWRDSQSHGRFRAFDPASGAAIGDTFPVSSRAEIEMALAAAATAAKELAATPAEVIADFLAAYATAIEADAERLTSLANQETGLPAATRLAGVELPRTCRQLRLAAEAARQHSWTQPVIDTTAGLRSSLGSLGKTVLIFGPNNFPLAFHAVAGSDFASAIAAGNPVIAKGHPSHPGTSRALAEIAQTTAQACGLPAASIQLLYHMESADGLALCGDPRLGAIAFTGSRHAGLALKAAADQAGIPFFGELSAINPVLMLEGALAERGAELAGEYVGSCTLGGGQFCTNPGLVVVPEGAAGDAFVATAVEKFDAAPPALLFSEGVVATLQQGIASLIQAGARLVAGQAQRIEPGFRFTPCLLEVDAAGFLAASDVLQTEVFGPVGLIVRSPDEATTLALIDRLAGSLTGSIYSAAFDQASAQRLARALRTRVGRLIANRMPTGVAVSAAMNHGGPYPASTHPGLTAVGMPSAIRRFAALHSWDHVPDDWLPVELQDANPLGVWRIVDGRHTDKAL